MKAVRQAAHQARRGAAGGARRARRQAVSAAVRGRPARRLDQPLVAVLEKRGRFLVAEPLFGQGPRTAVERGGAGEGDLVLVGSGKRGARVVRRLGRPDVARDVLEGLMLDRGLRRSYARAADRRGRGRGGRPVRGRRPRGPDRPADLHDRPRRRQGLRRRHLGAPRGRPRAALGAHRRRDRLRAPGRPARARGAAPRHERLRARRGRADAAGGALQPRLLAAPGRGQARRDGRDGDGRHRGAARRLPPLARAQRRAPHLRRGGRDLRRPRPRRGAVGGRARRRARGRPRARRRSARRVEIGNPEPSFEFDADGPRDRRALRGADGVAPADRAADDPGQRAGGRLPRRPAPADALPRARAPRPAGRGVPVRAARRPRRPDAAGARST